MRACTKFVLRYLISNYCTQHVFLLQFTNLILLLIIVNGTVDEVAIDDDDDDGVLLLLLILVVEVDDVLLLETVRDEILLLDVVVVIIDVVAVSGNDNGVVEAMVIGMVLLELTLCDLIGALLGEGGT